MSDKLRRSGESEQASQKLHVIVADDHPVVRAGIANELSRHPDIDVLGEAVNGDDTVRLVQTLTPEVLVLDINMPGLQAMKVLHQIQTLPAPPHTVILTAYSDLEYVLTMLKAGAKGYLLKDENLETITEAVRTVAQGKMWLSAQIVAHVIDHALHDAHDTDEPALSTREGEVVQLLADGKGNQEIGSALGISERTVRFHLHNIYDKLGVQRRSEAIAWAVRKQIQET